MVDGAWVWAGHPYYGLNFCFYFGLQTRQTRGCVGALYVWSNYDQMTQENMTSSFGLPVRCVPCQRAFDYAVGLDYSYVAVILGTPILSANDLAKKYESSKTRESASAIVSLQVTVIWRVAFSV